MMHVQYKKNSKKKQAKKHDHFSICFNTIVFKYMNDKKWYRDKQHKIVQIMSQKCQKNNNIATTMQ